MHMTIADEIRLEGKAEGKAERIAEGVREVLLSQGRKKFGEPDAATRQTLESLTNVDQLKRMSVAMFDVQSWSELLAVA